MKRALRFDLDDTAVAAFYATARVVGADPGEFMISRVVEVDEEGVCADFPLPH